VIIVCIWPSQSRPLPLPKKNTATVEKLEVDIQKLEVDIQKL
jgi:hypothetical protein